MSFAQVWTFLRWPLAIIGLLAVANYALGNLGEAAGGMIEFDASGSILAPVEEATEEELPLDDIATAEPVATLAPGTGPVSDGAAAPLADFHVSRSTADIDADELVIGDDPADVAVVAFDIPPGDPTCLLEVVLTMQVTNVVGAVELGVFPAAVDDPAGIRDNQEVLGDLRASPTPMANAQLTAPGTIAFDLTAAYAGYFTLGLPETQPFVVALAPTVPVAVQDGVRFEAADALGEAPPTLAWTADPACPAGVAPAPTEDEGQ